MNHLRQIITDFLFGFKPDGNSVSWSERFRAAFGVMVALSLVIGLGLFLSNHENSLPWVVASMGASAFLIFVLPSSPMAQPWAVIGGSCISALVGVLCSRWINPIMVAIYKRNRYSKNQNGRRCTIIGNYFLISSPYTFIV